ncbi:hypothetical protein KSP39_PZI014852 [Platanthera zijinensis]|uniref:ABC1 atypical kinase-like domain-containing protein n=1 Tax=Platanthera zijinensis TaxID=2320716 RepID=A0AAP0BBD6_9ASPA
MSSFLAFRRVVKQWSSSVGRNICTYSTVQSRGSAISATVPLPFSYRACHQQGAFMRGNTISLTVLLKGNLHKVVGIPLARRVFQFHGAFNRGNRSFARNIVQENLANHNSVRKYSTFSASSVLRYCSQMIWRRHFKMRSYKDLHSTLATRFTFAISLISTRFNLARNAIAFCAGELAWTKTALADGDYFPSSNSLYMQAQDSRIYIISLFFAVLECFILLLRAVYLAILFTPITMMAPFADCLGIKYRKMWLYLVHRTLERAGPAFIKWGQWAATRPDLFPVDLCNQLTKLHSKAPAHNFSYTKKTIEKAFGRKLYDIFDDFEEKPVASGSVAQVHRAFLRVPHPVQKSKRSVVAVKVRHPGVGESIRRDFVLINMVAKVSSIMPGLKWLRLDESVQQFAVFMMSQVDLAREAAHLSRFLYNFRSWKDVSFPKPLYPLVHPAVLVETFEHGESVSRYVDELEGHDRLKSALAHIGTHALLKMLLVDNFIHADMHPGNILVRESHSRRPSRRFFKSKPHVVFLDVGMTAELSSNDRVNLLEFFKAVALRDGRTAAECTLRLSKQQNCPNPESFIEEVAKSFSFWGTTEGDLVHPAECMHQLLNQVQRHKVNIDGNVCTVMVTTLVLEGWQRKLDPDYNVMHTLQTLLFKADWAETLLYTIEGLLG